MAQPVSLEQPDLVPTPRPEPRRDQWGRYVIPDPETGKERSWIRATTWSATVAETHALTRWELRMVALGLRDRHDLVTGIAGVLDPETPDGKKKLDGLIEQAKEYAHASARATVGTALHSFCEAHDSGRPLPRIPHPYDQDLAAYVKAMAGVKVSRNYIEKICLVPEFGVAGTMDRVVAFGASRLPLIGDIKTGKELGYSWTEIAIQLALYSRASTVWDPLTERHSRMLAVDQERALVIHLPAGEARCQLYVVDIAAGWAMAEVCKTVREWRNRKNLATPLLREEARG